LVSVLLTGGSADLATVDENCRYVAKHNLAIVIQGGIQGGVKAFERRWHVVAERDARALVNQHWDWITRVASHLAEHGHITGAMVKELE
jgi:transcriptional regulator with GAF, ATPase, and Fis domain